MIPTIDFQRIEALDPDTLAQIRRALHDAGAFFLDARSVFAEQDVAELFEQASGYFTLPEEEKRATAISRSANLRGYVGPGEEFTNGIADLKASFEFAREREAPHRADPPPYFSFYGPNLWPAAACLPRFQPVIGRFSERMDAIGLTVLKGIATSLDQPVSDLPGEGLFGGELCVFSRLIFYAGPGGTVERTRLEAHTDQSLLTAVIADAPGLEVEDADGNWRLVVPPPYSFTVFAGELMEFWSRGYLRACKHRVHGSALREDRHSIATFFLPDLPNRVAPIDPDTCAHLKTAPSSVSRGNVWLSSLSGGDSGGEALRPIIIGVKEWERMNAIFPRGADDREGATS